MTHGADRQTTLKATLIGVLALALWGALPALTVTVKCLPPFEILAVTFSAAFLGGLLFLAARGPAALRLLRQEKKAWLVAFGAIFGYHALYFYALGTVSPATASLIAYLWPLLVVLFSATGSGERLSVRHLAGALCGLVGTAVILLLARSAPAATGTGVLALTGYMAALLCAIIWSGYSIANRQFGHVPSAMVVGVCGAVAIAGAACHFLLENTVWPTSLESSVLLLIGLGPVGAAFLFWDHATKHGMLTLLGALSYLTPLLSTLLLIVFGYTDPSWSLLLAVLLIVGGAALAMGLPKPHPV
ncbi:DMT family transporter [Paraburkholderia sp. BCC1885]|uniref:DMT family transporter n=1 Tax=Paraburkholderia sp. BCC1885 TaxID=2562669 RepID=UPI0011828D4A|nr:EamA family transporter [Paraburkholderia sp. BCC1885]